MNDLISREKAIETLKEYEEVEFDNFTKTGPVSMMTVSTITNCIEAIAKLPSAEPERKKGKWMSHYDYCQKHELIPTGLVAFWWCDRCEEAVEHPTNFCPNCGAEMMNRGE